MSAKKILKFSDNDKKLKVVYESLIDILKEIFKRNIKGDVKTIISRHVPDNTATEEIWKFVEQILKTDTLCPYVEVCKDVTYIHFGEPLEPFFIFTELTASGVLKIQDSNFLECVEGFLLYYQLYHNRMGQFRPIHNFSIVSLLSNKQSKNFYEAIQVSRIDSEVLISLLPNDFWRITVGDYEFTIAEKDVKPLEQLANQVAILYGMPNKCVACGCYCDRIFCSKTCQNSIPCDSCDLRRLPYDYDLEQNDRSDMLICNYCTCSEIPLPGFSLSTLIDLVFDRLSTIASDSHGYAFECSKCDCFFMHGKEFIHKSKKKCFQCSNF